MLFNAAKGIIALDIDGTLTAETYALESEIIDFLSHLASENWKLIFITGRPFEWGFRSLKPLDFPYALAVQNGALLLDMPGKKILSRKYLAKSMLSSMETICQQQNTDFIVYSGLENDDRCYYRPTHLPEAILSYVLQRTTFLKEKWHPIQHFSQLPIDVFSSVKCFAKHEQAIVLSREMEAQLHLHAPINRDPFNYDYFVIQGTHREATKGEVLGEFMRITGLSLPVIAAGDDYNDFSLLKKADIKVVMANAPADLLQIADVIAPPASKKGIKEGLLKALQKLS